MGGLSQSVGVVQYIAVLSLCYAALTVYRSIFILINLFIYIFWMTESFTF